MCQHASHFTVTTLIALVSLVAVEWSPSVSAQEIITRGDTIGQSPIVELAQAIGEVDRYGDQTVILEGSVKKVCKFKGCWMELVSEGADRGIRVTFKDYAFFVPTDSTGSTARLEGVFEQNIFSKADADHLIAEGVTLTRRSDGTATEISFVAQAVELRK